MAMAVAAKAFGWVTKSMKGVTEATKTVAKSVAGINVVFAPLINFIGEFFSYIEPFADALGAIGAGLGTMLIPTMDRWVGIIIPLIPLAFQLGNALGGLFEWFSWLINPLMWIIGLLSKVYEMMSTMEGSFRNFGLSMNIGETLQKLILEGLSGLGNKIYQQISAEWDNLGARLTGGGADKKGWW